jgi:hypothetical protein
VRRKTYCSIKGSDGDFAGGGQLTANGILSVFIGSRITRIRMIKVGEARHEEEET